MILKKFHTYFIVQANNLNILDNYNNLGRGEK
jgi:hypothetical protein